ncbi:MAG: FadR family transcriptional regulator [Deltaproteobacteria bacterium]|nr:MAG: FadR family transcriptional regulator [Deltaproteobacteria bacterium]
MDSFHSVKSGKISEQIAQQIKNTILSGSMKPGDRLPPERDLVLRFQASRISVREALKRLEASGLLRIKPGSGVFIAEVNSKRMSESLSSILRIQKASINDLTEARIILEPNIARLASERITPEDLLKLEQNIEETSTLVQSDSPAPALNIEFHCLIAEFTHNPVITLSMKTLFDVLTEMTLEITENLPKRIETSSQAVLCHRKILKALREKESQNACELMRKHILQIQEGLKKAKSKTQ